MGHQACPPVFQARGKATHAIGHGAPIHQCFGKVAQLLLHKAPDHIAREKGHEHARGHQGKPAGDPTNRHAGLHRTACQDRDDEAMDEVSLSLVVACLLRQAWSHLFAA